VAPMWTSRATWPRASRSNDRRAPGALFVCWLMNVARTPGPTA
jgi:hypothetical protein